MALTGAYTVVVYALVRRGGLRRIGTALGVVLALTVFHVYAFATDFPDYWYVPMRYAIILLLVLTVAFAMALVNGRLRKGGPASPGLL